MSFCPFFSFRGWREGGCQMRLLLLPAAPCAACELLPAVSCCQLCFCCQLPCRFFSCCCCPAAAAAVSCCCCPASRPVCSLFSCAAFCEGAALSAAAAACCSCLLSAAAACCLPVFELLPACCQCLFELPAFSCAFFLFCCLFFRIVSSFRNFQPIGIIIIIINYWNGINAYCH